MASDNCFALQERCCDPVKWLSLMRSRAGGVQKYHSLDNSRLTSISVDQATNKVMQNIIAQEFADRTVLFITHRIHDIVDFDRVAVMADGKCIEFDSPRALLQTKGSLFSELFKNYHDNDVS
jgi:hypothetical protein